MKLFICGDIVNYKRNDGKILSSEMKGIVQQMDLAICNVEAPLKSEGAPQPKIGPHHHQHPKTLQGLAESGFNLFCLANNHIMDYGEAGLQLTLEESERLGVPVIGADLNRSDAYQPYIYEQGRQSVGIINAAEAQFGVLDHHTAEQDAGYAWIEDRQIDQQIMTLNQQCDVVIVIAHAGLEHYAIPQREWRERYKQFCDLGADVVIGHHPHVPQGYESYGDSMIFYSLGNFYFDSSNFANKPDYTYSVELTIDQNSNVSFRTIQTYKDQNQVLLTPSDQQFSLDALNAQLHEGYEEACRAMNEGVYDKIIKPNLIYSITPTVYDGGIVSTVKRFIRQLRRKPNNKKLLSSHLIRNETYYYAMRQALQAKGEGESS